MKTWSNKVTGADGEQSVLRAPTVMAADGTFKKAPKAKVAGTGSTAALLKKDDSLPSDEKTEKTFKK